MATIGKTMLDLIDYYKSIDDAKQIVPVIEMLNEQNPILTDALFVECNNGNKHLTTVRTGLPSVAWGRLYKGTPNDKSTRAQVEDSTGFVEGRASVDARLIDELSNGNGPSLRLSEATAFLESMGQEVATKIFYGNDAEAPDEFMGLAPRFNELSARNGGQIVDALEFNKSADKASRTDLTSIWFVTWGENQCSMIYPKGSYAGVKRDDRGKQTIADSDGNRFEVYEEVFRQHAGLSVRDWRYVVRIANISITDLAAGDIDLYGAMRHGYYKLHNRRVQGGRLMCYMNKDILEALDQLANERGASDTLVRLTRSEVQGQEVVNYRGVPIREVDALINSEEKVA